MSERLEFLHLEKRHNEIMQDSWQQYIEEGGGIARPASQSSSGPDQLPEQPPSRKPYAVLTCVSIGVCPVVDWGHVFEYVAASSKTAPFAFNGYGLC